MPIARHRFYVPFAFAGVIHGAAFSALLWFGLTHMVSTQNSSMPLPGVQTTCEVLLFIWPVWVPALLWSCKRGFHIFLPLGLGFVGLAPGLFYLLVMLSMGHNC
jgi:hypothetical protein